MLADLALHRLDIVLADRPAPNNKNLNVYSQELRKTVLGWYASKQLVKGQRENFLNAYKSFIFSFLKRTLPCAYCLINGLHNITPNIVGEFEDSALLKTFAASGLGAFPAGLLIENHLKDTYGLELLGSCENIHEYFYAIRSEKKMHHPLVQTIIKQQRLAKYRVP